MNIYLIGAGCGSMGTQTLEATEKLEACDLIIGARRLVEGLPERYEGKCISAHKPDIADARSMSTEQADVLEAWIKTLPGVDRVTVHERTRSGHSQDRAHPCR